MILLIFLLILTAVTLIFIAATGSAQVSGRHIPAAVAQAQERKNYLSRLFPFSRRLLKKLRLEAKIKDKLDAAHIKLAPAEFFNLKLILIVSLGLLAFFVLKKSNPMALLFVLVAGYSFPDLLLNKKITQRKHIIARTLPETVDLLGLCVEAGLDFTTALKWLIEKSPSNAMIEEFAFLLEEIKWGKSRNQALKDMAKRLNIPEVNSFIQTLVQSERMGTPVAETFTILSEDTRLQRFHQGERYALQAPIKILIPLIFCILPVIAIVIGGPILLQFMQGGLFKGF